MLAQAHTFTLDGSIARHVVVEVDVRAGLPAFTIVGLADAAVREARERIQTAIRNSGFHWPARRVTANLAPGDLRKAGPGLDLALACAILAATGQVPTERLRRIAMFGELGLDGEVRPAHGTLAVADAAHGSGLGALALAAPAGHAARLVEGLEVAPLRSLQSAARLLRGGAADPLPPRFEQGREHDGRARDPHAREPELAEFKGTPQAVRALLIVAAGAHSLLLRGPPGAGKTMLARRLPGILPELSSAEAVELARLRNFAPAPGRPLERRRPFRAPHHTTSAAGMVGGAANGRLGEAVLAHRGVLFLDELAEFSRDAVEVLRQPIEEGQVSIARARRTASHPARFMLVCATNPCACGADAAACRCSARERERHARRLSGPFLDRIDARVELDASNGREQSAPSSAAARALVTAARERQHARLAREGVALNAEMDAGMLARHVRLDARGERLLAAATGEGLLSRRGAHSAAALARTIADLAGRERVRAQDVAEALMLRTGRRGGFS